ncbi:MAG: iron chelate uptake ABC transporter family permease subunit [bacterium]
MPLAGLPLAGVALGLTLSAALSAVLLAARERAGDVLLWLMGHLGGARWAEVGAVAACLAAGGGLLASKASELNAFLLGEEVAASLGVAVERMKARVLLATALLVAGAVAFTGLIGFIGLVVPHAVRLATGADHRRLLPVAALVGATTLILADLGARSLITGELPVGIITGALGGPFFLVLLRRSLRR